MVKPKAKSATKQPGDAPSYAPKDVVLGKIRGYPPWPGQVMDPLDAPPKVKAERPKSGAKAFSLVQFFPTGDFAWLMPKDISRLKRHEIDAYINEPSKKSGELLAAYRVALDPSEWEAGRPAPGADEDEDADADADGEIDELASEPSDNKRKRKAPPSKKAGKRSKKEVDAESEEEGEPPAKKPKKSVKKDKEDGDKKDQDAEGDADGELPKDKKALEVRDWRHKLQKTFLGKGIAKESDLPNMDTLFKTVENHEDITIDQLTFSKIGKVMRHIHALSDDKMPPGGDSKYKFRERAKTLVDRWHQVLNSGKDDSTKNGHVAKEEALSVAKEESKVEVPDQNGDAKMDSVPPPSAPLETETAVKDATTIIDPEVVSDAVVEPTTNGIAVEDEKMDEDNKPAELTLTEAQKETDSLVQDAFMGDLTMDMSMES